MEPVAVEPVAVEAGTPIETDTWGQQEFGCLFEKEWERCYTHDHFWDSKAGCITVGSEL